MNAAQIHLMLNHIPVLGIILVTILLGIGLSLRHGTLVRLAFITLVGIALAAIPVYFSGGASEDQIERLPNVQESLIEKHEEVAKVVSLGLGVLGLASIIALIRFRRHTIPLAFSSIVLVAAVALSGALAWTAHLGGQIRHAELGGTARASATSAEDHLLPERD